MSDGAPDSATMEEWAAGHAALIDSIFEGAAFGLALVDRDLRFVRVNEVMGEINGQAPADHVGRLVSDVLSSVPDEVADASRRVLETGAAVRDITVMGPMDDDVGQRTFECSYHPVLAEGEVVGIWSSVREITAEVRLAAAERRLSDQLAEERRVLEEVVAQAPGALALLWGPDLRIRAFNEELVRNAPDREHLLGRPVAEAFPEVAALTRGAAEAVLERGETISYEELGLPWGGEGSIDGNRHYSFSVTPIAGSDGKAAGALVVAQDVTSAVRRRLDLEEELQAEHRISAELQVSLRPDLLPEVPGADIASGFRPAGVGHEISGDFFDVFGLSEECWMMVIGDVCGKGAEAASLTALARYTLRAAAIQEGAEPCTLLAQLNEAIRRQRDDLRFLTCVCAFVKPAAAGALELTVCVAGHPSPLRIDSAGAVTRVGGDGALLGAWDNPRLEQETFELRPGETLVLYTDGVTEAGAPHHEMAEQGLVELLSRLPPGRAQATVEAIERAVVSRTDAPPRDDIAVLVLRPDPGAKA